MKPGTKLKSRVCTTEVMVIRCGEGSIECGGTPMTEADCTEKGTIDPAHAGGTFMGKRYVDEARGMELLCLKAGKGSLSIDGEPLVRKDPKSLPASD